MNEMLQRAVEAIKDSSDNSPEGIARTVISALREPTDAMKNCNDEVHWDYSCHVCGGLKEGWQAMIDEALK